MKLQFRKLKANEIDCRVAQIENLVYFTSI